MAETKAKSTATKDEALTPQELAAKKHAYLMERVKIKLHKDRNNHADFFVSVNDYTAYIKRGVVVEVPRYVANVIQQSAEQDERTIEMIDRLTRDDM